MTVIHIPDEQAAAKLANEDPTPDQIQQPQAAAQRIREIQKRSLPDPEGWTIRDYIHYGRR